MARSRRDAPPRMFQRSESRRLMSMTFLLVILLMIIQNSRGPDNKRLLVGRDGSHDRVVGKIEVDDDQPERVPAKPKPGPAASAAMAGSGSRTLALAQANGSTPDSSTPAPKTSPDNSTRRQTCRHHGSERRGANHGDSRQCEPKHCNPRFSVSIKSDSHPGSTAIAGRPTALRTATCSGCGGKHDSGGEWADR